MVQHQRQQVLRSDGVAGSVLPTQDGTEALLVQFDDGLRVLVPRALLREQQGQLRLELAAADLDALRGGVARVIPVVAETARVATRVVDTGGVRVQLGSEEYQAVAEASLEQVRAAVTRVPVNRVLDEGAPVPEPRQEGDTLIIPLVEEEIVLVKRRVLREELRITRTRETSAFRQSVTLRRNTVSVETLEPAPADQEPRT